MRVRFQFLAALIMWPFTFGVLSGQDVQVETVVDGLTHPCGLAIQPKTGTVFVADSGAGRIVRVVDGKLEEVVVDFPLDEYGKGPKYKIGPLGLAFIDQDTLIVGGGGNPDDKEIVRVYSIPKPGTDAISADNMEASFGLSASENEMAEGNYFGVVLGEFGLYVTCNGDDAQGWITKADVKEKQLSNFRRFIPTTERTQQKAPVAITKNSRGELVVGQMGSVDQAGDGGLGIYNAKSGKLLSLFATDLSDLCGLAFSPKTGLLYGTDFAWASHDAGTGVNSAAGLFRLDADRFSQKPRVKSTRILELDKPTALTFAEDGTLFITIFDSAKGGKPTGRLLKVAPGL